MVFISFSYKHRLELSIEALIIQGSDLNTEVRTTSEGASS